jgi:uncharacterized protein
MPAFKELLLAFIADLRAAGVRISVGESLDAMNAIPLASLERVCVREALRASLIKDAADDPIFETEFARCFGFVQSGAETRSSRAAYNGVNGQGDKGSPAESTAIRPSTSSEKQRTASFLPARLRSRETNQGPDEFGCVKSEPKQSVPPAAQGNRITGTIGLEELIGKDADLEGGELTGSLDASGIAQAARLEAIARLPFSDYTNLNYEQARDVLAVLNRRLRVRLGRRMRLAAKGRIDFRRTIRAAIQRGGAMADLRFRARRPRHIDLLLLADISGSVKYAANLMLEIVAGARACFHRVTSLVYIDRLAEAAFEQGHLVITPLIDLYARSDFGQVLAELLKEHRSRLGPTTVVVIMGDGRNNRRPARVDLMRDLRRSTRAIVWLNPEPPERWGTGDSAIRQYDCEVDAIIPCGKLSELEAALGTLI